MEHMEFWFTGFMDLHLYSENNYNNSTNRESVAILLRNEIYVVENSNFKLFFFPFIF